MKQHIPNFITLLNLFCGCIAIFFTINGAFEEAAVFFFLGVVFDFLDGFVARILKVQSELGVQLDSLADMVTSGVLPGVVMFKLLNMALDTDWSAGSSWNTISFEPLALIGFIITLASGYRLAKFNIDENQVSSFIGLPTPANALVIVSLPLILMYQNNPVLESIILNVWFLVGLTLLSAYLLNSKIALFALKFKTWSFADNAIRYIFLIISLVLLATLKYLAVPAIILLYVGFSLFDTSSKK